MTTDDRPAHVAWCQRRALYYVDCNELANALASMGSDMTKRDDCKIDPVVGFVGLTLAAAGDADGVRRWIRAFQ